MGICMRDPGWLGGIFGRAKQRSRLEAEPRRKSMAKGRFGLKKGLDLPNLPSPFVPIWFGCLPKKGHQVSLFAFVNQGNWVPYEGFGDWVLQQSFDALL
jgi:hypothetical protein